MNDIVAPDSSAAPLPAAPARPGRVRRFLVTGLPVVLVAGALVGAAAYTKITVDHADRTVETTVWAGPDADEVRDPALDVSRGRATTELSKLLLPVPPDYRLGPDIRDYGNDGEIGGKKATAAMKRGNRELAGKERRALDERIDRLHVQGLAVRSYVSNHVGTAVEIQIVRMKDTKAVRNLHTFRTGLLDAVGVFRDGPKIKGHKRTAACFLLPKDSEDSKDPIEGMLCSAYDGELSISFSAHGSEPFDETAVAELLTEQLDHITSPGEYV